MHISLDSNEARKGYDHAIRAYYREGVSVAELKGRLLRDIKNDNFNDYDYGIMKSLSLIKSRQEKCPEWLENLIYRRNVKSTQKI